MSKRSEIPVLLVSLLVTLGILGGLGFWGWRFFKEQSQPLSGAGTPPATGTPSGTSPPPSGQTAPLGNPAPGQSLSAGQRSLFAVDPSSPKQAALTAIAAGNYGQAIAQLEATLQQNRNDPEALIYLNNVQAANTEALTIAVVVPAATAENPALEILRGVAQAQTEVNQTGGIQGQPLRVILADDGNTPEGARAVAEQLVADSEVLAAIGHFSSGVTLDTEPVYTEGQLPLISPTSTAVRISGVSNYVFRTVPSDRFAASALARYLLSELNQQRVGVFYNSDSSYSVSLKEEFTTAVFGEGGEVVTEFDLGASGFDAGQALAQLQNQQAEAIMLAANTPTLDQALAVIAANQGRLALLGGDSLYNPRVLDVGGASAAGLGVAIPWHLQAYPQSDFFQTSQTLWGGDVNWRTAMAYDAIKAIAAALEQVPTVSRENLQQTLSRPDFQAQGATTAVRFLPSGDRNQAVQLVTVEPGSRSGYGYDFVPVTQP